MIEIAALILIPAIILFFSARYIARLSRLIQIMVFTSVGLFLIGISIAFWLELSFYKPRANLIAVSVAYICFGLLAFSAFRFKPKLLGVFAGIALSIAFVGALFFQAFILAISGFASSDVYQSRLNSKNSCLVTSFGNATTTEDGFDVHLFKSILLGLEKEFISERFSEPTSVLSYKEMCQRAYLLAVKRE